MHLSQSFQSCKFAKWQWSKLSLEGMVLKGRLKWLRECKREHQRGREDISVYCQILSWLVLHLHFPSVSLSSHPGNTNRFDNSLWKQLPLPNATAIQTAHCSVLHSDVYTEINPPPFYIYFHSVLLKVCIIYGNRKVERTSDAKKSIICLSSIVLNIHILTDTQTHPCILLHPHTHTHTYTHTHSHNRCLVSGVLYL